MKNLSKATPNGRIGLTHLFKRGYIPQRLHIYDRGHRNSISGIRATIFGGTGFLGPFVGATLGYMSSDLIFPHNHQNPFDDDVKELKLCANLGQSYLVRHMNFDDQKMIDRVIANSNVVVNLIGPRKRIKYRKDFEHINIEIPRRIAQAAKRNPRIIRLIHFSACGAAPDSPSLDLQTKYYGEQEVKSIFPNVTIIRPTTIYGPYDYFVRHIMTQREFFYNFIPVTDDCSAKRQPIWANDVGLCVLNALKLHETRGKTYEIGGPNVYTMLEVYELLHNLTRRECKLAYVPKKWAMKFAESIYNWEFFNLDSIVKHELDLVVSPGANTIDDLFVKPVSFPQAVERQIRDAKVPETNQDEILT
eukprot:TRINITY_DN1143_c0_g2_i1.p1 TRINITY_DN1143_c0_g2~~TRINITY_DN1143_c0_g2_i1.p1  ORF type:complete len:361 (+),score=105.14 TRINITY_DN1143_c0_g2_i1:28-1110(+)